MIKLCLYFIFECLIFIVMIKIIKLKNEDKSKTISFKLLASYISQENKKRKFNKNTCKILLYNGNSPTKTQNNKIYCQKQEIVYRKLKPS